MLTHLKRKKVQHLNVSDGAHISCNDCNDELTKIFFKIIFKLLDIPLLFSAKLTYYNKQTSFIGTCTAQISWEFSFKHPILFKSWGQSTGSMTHHHWSSWGLRPIRTEPPLHSLQENPVTSLRGLSDALSCHLKIEHALHSCHQTSATDQKCSCVPCFQCPMVLPLHPIAVLSCLLKTQMLARIWWNESILTVQKCLNQ